MHEMLSRNPHRTDSLSRLLRRQWCGASKPPHSADAGPLHGDYRYDLRRRQDCHPAAGNQRPIIPGTACSETLTMTAMNIRRIRLILPAAGNASGGRGEALRSAQICVARQARRTAIIAPAWCLAQAGAEARIHPERIHGISWLMIGRSRLVSNSEYWCATRSRSPAKPFQSTLACRFLMSSGMDFDRLTQLGKRVLDGPISHPVGMRQGMERIGVHVGHDVAQVRRRLANVEQPLGDASADHQNARTISRAAASARAASGHPAHRGRPAGQVPLQDRLAGHSGSAERALPPGRNRPPDRCRCPAGRRLWQPTRTPRELRYPSRAAAARARADGAAPRQGGREGGRCASLTKRSIKPPTKSCSFSPRAAAIAFARFRMFFGFVT